MERLELLQGTLNPLMVRAILPSPDEDLLVGRGAPYPARQRLEERGSISAKCGTSSNNREVRFASPTVPGHPHLVREAAKRQRFLTAIRQILGHEVEG